MSALRGFHTYTTASDGQYTPTELVGLAKRWGLSVLAVAVFHRQIGAETPGFSHGKEAPSLPIIEYFGPMRLHGKGH